jgi:hypothetical protein
MCYQPQNCKSFEEPELSWIELQHAKKRQKEAKERKYALRKEYVLEDRRMSLLKGRLCKEILNFSEKNNVSRNFLENKVEMGSDLLDFKKLFIQLGDVNLAWKYNKLVRGFIGNDLSNSANYIIKF